MTGRRLAVLPALALLAGCGASAHQSSAAVTASGPPPAAQGCVDASTAQAIWTGINSRLNAIALDPQHQGLADVATGAALTKLQEYIQSVLVAHNLTEREVDALNDLSIDDAGCSGSLRLTVTTTATRDDYLKPDGSVDHSDPVVGMQIHSQETYDRVGGVWKMSDLVSLDAPTPTAQVV